MSQQADLEKREKELMQRELAFQEKVGERKGGERARACAAQEHVSHNNTMPVHVYNKLAHTCTYAYVMCR